MALPTPEEVTNLYLYGTTTRPANLATDAVIRRPGAPRPVVPVTMTLGGQSITPAYVGLTPFAVGLFQITFQVPHDAPLNTPPWVPACPLAAVLPILFWLRRRTWFVRDGVRFASTLVAVAGLIWFVQRVT